MIFISNKNYILSIINFNTTLIIIKKIYLLIIEFLLENLYKILKFDNLKNIKKLIFLNNINNSKYKNLKFENLKKIKFIISKFNNINNSKNLVYIF